MDFREFEYLTPIPRGYLKSDSTRDCRLSNRRRPKIRVKAPVGITGGYVAGRDSSADVFRQKRAATPKRTTEKVSRADRITARRNNAGRIAR